MYKYLSIVALSLCGCAAEPHLVAAPTSTPAPVSESESVLSSSSETSSPITIELAHQREAQIIRCSDEVDCFQKLTGLCPNGYNGGQTLHAGNDRVVGTVFRCITDEEKAEGVRQQAEADRQQAEWEANRAAQAQKDAAQQAAKKHPAKK
jgi:hypothetical protein